MTQRVPKQRTHVEPKPRTISREEARQFFEAEAQRLFGMSGDEWVRRYDAGEFDEIFDTTPVLDMYFMLPWYRDVPTRNDK